MPAARSTRRATSSSLPRSPSVLARASPTRGEPADRAESSARLARPQRRKHRLRLEPSERGDDERRVAVRLEQRARELHRRCVDPVQILEHDEHRTARELGARERDPRARDAILHQLLRLARGAQLGARRVVERRADHLGEKPRDLFAKPLRNALRHALDDGVTRRLAAEIRRARELPHEHGHRRQRRVRAQRVALDDPHRRVRRAPLDASHRFFAQPRFSAPRFAEDHDRRRLRSASELANALSIVDSSRVRPTNGVTRPSTTRADSNALRSA